MNEISLGIEHVTKENSISIDGILFENCFFISLSIDNLKIVPNGLFSESLIYWSELFLSVRGSGQFLIFTCACGVADDGGWDRIYVQHKEEYVKWSFFYDEHQYNFTFQKEQYFLEIERIRNKLAEINNRVKLEPKNVIFPK
jgi:hypothetical protein